MSTPRRLSSAHLVFERHQIVKSSAGRNPGRSSFGYTHYRTGTKYQAVHYQTATPLRAWPYQSDGAWFTTYSNSHSTHNPYRGWEGVLVRLRSIGSVVGQAPVANLCVVCV
jgi:hypothetical protein